MTEKASQPGQGTVAAFISFAVLLFSAGGVFGELQDSLNVIWHVQPDPTRGWTRMIRERFFSLTLVMGTAFILLVSLIVNSILASMVNQMGIGWFWSVVNFVVSLLVITCLFALILKYVPDAHVSWPAAWYGAAISALLFTLGRIALAWYLGRGSVINVYGAAGSLAAMLIWTYYNGWIIFFGGEFTRAVMKIDGPAVEPEPVATRAPQQMAFQRQENIPYTQTPKSDRPRRVRRTIVGVTAGAAVCGVIYWLSERAGPIKAFGDKPPNIESRIFKLERQLNQLHAERTQLALRVLRAMENVRKN